MGSNWQYWFERSNDFDENALIYTQGLYVSEEKCNASYCSLNQHPLIGYVSRTFHLYADRDALNLALKHDCMEFGHSSGLS